MGKSIYIVQVKRGTDDTQDDVNPYLDKDEAMRFLNGLIDHFCEKFDIYKEEIEVGLDSWQISPPPRMENTLFDVTIYFKEYIV